ncbi:MAG: transporter [Oceanospirillaceae bacterium]|nr:transporter [Oceanospirillaceae bacterium]|tara:strand:- start:228 stop:1175 length:948 start_codon:yes stop_codon:yes gene_type:complete
MKFVSHVLLALMLPCLIFPLAARAADYPDGPVTFIVPWPEGDLEDHLTKLIAKELTAETGVATDVKFIPGDAGATGAAVVAEAPADGQMIGSLVNHLLTTKVMGGEVSWNFKTFSPIGIFLDYPFVIAARADAPYNNLNELAEYSHSHNLSLGHFGNGITPTALTFKMADDFQIKISSDKAYDALECPLLLNGSVDIMNTTTQQIFPCLESGEAKLLVAFTSRRVSIAPDVPTLSELTGINLTIWNGLFVPRATSAMTKVKIARIAKKAMESEEAKQLARDTGALIYWDDAMRSKIRIADEIEASRNLLKYLQRQ